MTSSATQDTMETGTVRVNADVELSYERRGQGPDVLLINNTFMDKSSWRPFTSRLADDCRLLSYDLRGQGASGTPEREASWADHVQDVIALLDGVGARQVVLVGTSFSAVLCRDVALAYPDRVRGMVLAGPALSPWGKRRHRRIVSSWLTTLDTVGLSAMYDQLYPVVSGDYNAEVAGTAGFLGRKQGFLALHSAESVRAGMAVSLTADGDPTLLTRVQCPTLLVVGDDDFGLGPTGVAELVKLLPHGRAVIFPQVGHLPFIEQPDRFQDEVAAFVTEITQADA